MRSFSSSPLSSLLLFLLSLASLFFFSSSSQQTATFGGVGLDNPVLQFIPSQFGYSSLHGAEDITSCERVSITGLSRLKIKSYADSFHVLLKVSDEIPEGHRDKAGICFHQNASLGLCQCAGDEWRSLQKGQWVAIMSPYGHRYVDVKFVNGASGSITISVEEEFQQWRLFFLAVGFALLLLAPVVSSWVPFYYSSSMALGVLLVILIILFQGMKLLPTGRKSFLYLTIYGSVLGAGSFLVHYFSMAVNSILVNFGLSEEMHNPVSVFLLVGIILSGAALGYWVVRKFVLSEDGTVDAGIAQFVKWAMRITAFMFIFQSTLDSLLALVALIISWITCSVITSSSWRLTSSRRGSSVNVIPWQRRARQAVANHKQAEFFSRSPKTGRRSPAHGILNSPYAWSNSPTQGIVYSSPRQKMACQQDYYSSFHKTPPRKFSKKEWDEFTHESTREALADWASTPEFSEWIAENAHRIKLEPNDSSDESVDSSLDSEETGVGSGSVLSFLGWS